MKSFFAQFGHPRGALGALVGHLMAIKNGERSRWLLGILSAKEGERVLEVGFGPGVDLRRLSGAVGSTGFVAGADASEVMLRQATTRNPEPIASGRMQLERASATALPFGDASFDAVYSTNSAQFWPDLVLGMREIHRVLAPGGRALVGVQPMSRGATEADARRWLDRLRAAADEVGFVTVLGHERRMRPVLAVSVLAARAALG